MRHRLASAIAATLLAATLSPVGVEAATVTASRVACRSAAAATAPVVATLARGGRLPVSEVARGWARVDNLPACWVPAGTLSDTIVSGAPAVARAKARPEPVLASPARARQAQRTAARKSARTAACACARGKACVDARSRRYCLTRSGTRRYGV